MSKEPHEGYLKAIANQLFADGSVIVRTPDILTFIEKLETGFSIKATFNQGDLPDGQYYLSIDC